MFIFHYHKKRSAPEGTETKQDLDVQLHVAKVLTRTNSILLVENMGSI